MKTIETSNSKYKKKTVAQAQNPALNFFTTAVIDSEFKDISLSDYNGRYLVFFWYPADFTLSCSNEIIAFSNRMSEFSNLNTAFIAVSADSGMRRIHIQTKK
jgi:peroxiredoxin (alkyl hydroperoxide reductase subunit C)